LAFNAITTGEQSVTTTGAVTGVLDTSAYTRDLATAKLRVTSFGAGQTAIVALQDTANSTAFSDAIPVAVFHVRGNGGTEPTDFFVKLSEIPNTRIGVANAKLRFNVLSISGGTLKLNGWLEP
jgi:hypothetical protein